MALTVNTNIVNDGDKYLLDAKNVKGTFSVISSFDELEHPTAHTIYPTQIVGSLVYNTSDSKFYRYNGSTWDEVFTKIDTDTNTWRTIKVNNTEILGSATSTNALNLVPGTHHISVTPENSSGYTGKITIDTDLESKTAASGGTAESLVTTGEKYTWNNKSDFSGNYNDLTNKPTLFSGNYNDLTNKPTIPTVNNAILTITQNGTGIGTFTANSNTDTTIEVTDTTYSSETAEQGGTAVSLVTTGEKYIWNNKQDAITIDSAVSLSSSNPVQNKAIGNYIAARGEHLLTNGFANLKNNYNFTAFAYDGSDTYYANGCFKKMGWGAYATYTNDEPIPVDVNMTYRFDFYTKTNHSGAQVNGYIRAYDIDGNEIGSYQVAPRANTLTTLAQDLKNGDTKIYLTDMSNWQSTNLGTNNASILIYGYANSYGYIYPPETYTRYRYTSLWSQASQMDYENNCITLTSAWNKGPFSAGTPISQGQDGSGALYCNIDDVSITCTLKTDSDSATQAMNGWEHHWYHINGVQNKNTFATSQFPFGTAYIKVGLMNRISQASTEYFKLSTMSMTTSAASVDQFKIPSSTGSYNYDYPLLFKNHKNQNTEVANTSFATTLTYNPHSKVLKVNGTAAVLTDTKNTAGTTNKAATKLFLVGAQTQEANPTTYSNVNCYIGTDNCLYSNGQKVLTSYTPGVDTNQTITAANVTFDPDVEVELVAGSNIGITADSTHNQIIISSTASGSNQMVKAGDVTFDANDIVNFVNGDNISVVGDATAKTITITGTSPGNGILTLNRNAELGNSKVEVGTFTANQSTNTSLDISDLYYCTYSATGEGTTVAEIDAALAANKLPVCWFSNRLYIYFGINSNYRYFSCVTNRSAYIIRIIADSSSADFNKWSNDYDTFEFQYYKRTSTQGWGGGDLTNVNNNNYPSEKLVYDSLSQVKQSIPSITLTATAGEEALTVNATGPVNLATRDTAQTISGAKTFSTAVTLNNNISLQGKTSTGTATYNLVKVNNVANGIEVGDANTALILQSSGSVIPNGNGTKSLGAASYSWDKLYISGAILDGTNSYGLVLPSTSGWSSSKTIATTDQLVNKVNPATDNAAVRFDGTSGAIQDSAVIITDDKRVKAHGYILQTTASSTTTDKVEMLYDASEECIKFVFN